MASSSKVALDESIAPVKTEPSIDDIGLKASISHNVPLNIEPPHSIIPSRSFIEYKTADEIEWTPEEAFKEGLLMLEYVQAEIRRPLGISNRRQRDIWNREFENLKVQRPPDIMIAICGATGSGKSSTLNALMDDNILPTNGMRACTSVVTEIRYHTDKFINAQIPFLTRDQWKSELVVLLSDILDESTGKVKRSTDLRSEAGVAWAKLEALYPSIPIEQLVNMSADEIISLDPKIEAILGTTKRVTASNSKSFSRRIARYVDSRNEKRKGKENGKHADDLGNFSLWPLIKQVTIRCSAPVLSTGIILVDLPGSADANAARNQIAKQYMEKCDRVWILAPITRAVDDKTARDLMGKAFKMQLMNGSYDDKAITFVATKCDDISCSEVVDSLKLDGDPRLQEIEKSLRVNFRKLSHWKAQKTNAEKEMEETNRRLNELRECLAEYREHLASLLDGKTFTPHLTSQSRHEHETESFRGTKRKNSQSGDKDSKRRKSSVDPFNDDSGDYIMDDDKSSTDELESESEIVEDSNDVVFPDVNDVHGAGDINEKPEDAAMTSDGLNERIAWHEDAIMKEACKLSALLQRTKQASDTIGALKDTRLQIQKDKSTFCSLMRSEFSRRVLKDDFRMGLKDLDDAVAEQRDSDSFDPAVASRDYDVIDLPVFTCSSRDYVRLTGQVKGDGSSACFSKVEDTGIPELQRWCHKLAAGPRRRSANAFLAQLQNFAASMLAYVENIGDTVNSEHPEQALSTGDQDSLRVTSSQAREKESGSDNCEELVEIDLRLEKRFSEIASDCVRQMQTNFRHTLETRCRTGTTEAAAGAVETSDEFASRMHWRTYRATLRRHGSWKDDLNAELTNPITLKVVNQWTTVFKGNEVSSVETKVMSAVKKLLRDVEKFVTVGLKERARKQSKLCRDLAGTTLTRIINTALNKLKTEQRNANRCLVPHVQEILVEGYDNAMEERGPGSVAGQKRVMHDYVDEIKDTLFSGAIDMLMERLSDAAETIGQTLQEELETLAEKIEASMSVIWKAAREDAAQRRTRKEIAQNISEVVEQVQLWQQAAERCNLNVSSSASAGH